MEEDDHTEGGQNVLSDTDNDGDLPDLLDSLSTGTDKEKKKKSKSKKHKSKKHKRDKEDKSDSPGFLPAIATAAPAISHEPEVWERCHDGKNVYYYNAATNVSAWLAPCSVCHSTAAKWCIDCQLSYCEHDFEAVHDGEDSAPEMLTHTPSYTEIAGKDELQPGEVYCIKCNVRTASRLCVQCDEDPYCAECFRMVHCCGYLKCHRPVAYARAKAGWMFVKSTNEKESDHYLNGTTKEISTEKPVELMSELEILHKKNFETHKKRSEAAAKELELLKQQIEETSQERGILELEQIKRKAEIAAEEAKEKKKR